MKPKFRKDAGAISLKIPSDLLAEYRDVCRNQGRAQRWYILNEIARVVKQYKEDEINAQKV